MKGPFETLNEIHGIADEAVDLFYRRCSGAADRYPLGARERCLEDMRLNLRFIAGAAFGDSLPVLVDYLAWCQGLFINLGLPAEDFRPSLDCLAESIDRYGNGRARHLAAMLRLALDRLDGAAAGLPSLACADGPLTDAAQDYLSSLLTAEPDGGGRVVKEALDAGMPIDSIYLDMVAPAMREVGRLWHARRISVAEEHYATACSQTLLSSLYPRIFAVKPSKPVLLAACVEGELHELGMRMVADLLQMDGWDTRFLGANTPPQALAQLAERTSARLIALSAMTAASLPAVAAHVEALRRRLGEAAPAIVVGGYPFQVDGELWRRVGADATAADGRQAVLLARQMVKGLC